MDEFTRTRNMSDYGMLKFHIGIAFHLLFFVLPQRKTSNLGNFPGYSS
jgi:hypothetical protein